MGMVRDALESRESSKPKPHSDPFDNAMDALDDEFGEGESGLPSTPPLPEPAGKSAVPGGLKYIKAHSDVDSAARKLFGRDVSPEEMGSLTGIAAAAGHVPGGHVEMRTKRNWDTGEDDVSLSYFIPGILDISRTIGRDKDGNLHIHNDIFKLESDELKGKGIGIDVFSSEVEQAIKENISYIDTYAAGSYQQSQLQGEDKWLGYYVWPRFGYQRTIELEDIGMYSYRMDENKLNFLASATGRTTDDLRENRSFEISDLMKTPEGQKWWKINGHGGGMKFDLAEGSVCRRVLSEYRKEKGIDQPGGPNRFRMQNVHARDDIYGYPDYYPRAIRRIARDVIKDEIAQFAKPSERRIGRFAPAGSKGDCGHVRPASQRPVNLTSKIHAGNSGEFIASFNLSTRDYLLARPVASIPKPLPRQSTMPTRPRSLARIRLLI